VEAITYRLPREHAPPDTAEPRKIAEADRDVDRDDNVAAAAERQAERKVGIGRARLVEIERAFQRAEPQPERVWIRDSRPQAHARARHTDQPDFRGLIADLLETRRLHEGAELIESGACL